MRNCIDETIVLLVPANLTNEKAGIENDAGDYGTEEEHAEYDLHILLPIEDDPAETNGRRSGDEQNAEGKKEGDFSPPADSHTGILARCEESSRC